MACQASPPTAATGAEGDAPRAATDTAQRASASSSALDAVTSPPSGAELRISATAAQAGGLPPIGFSVSGVWEGFTRSNRPRSGTYLSLAGPPGDLLMLVIKPHVGAATPDALDAAFRAWVQRMPHAAPIVAGPPETVTVGARGRFGRAYHVGPAGRTASWCASFVPADAKTALLVIAGAGVREISAPRCAPVVEHPRLAPLLRSLRLEASAVR